METLVEQAAQPGLSSVTVKWHQHNSYDPTPMQAPSIITSVFSGARLVIYGFVENCLQAELQAWVKDQQVNTLVSTHELGITKDTVCKFFIFINLFIY